MPRNPYNLEVPALEQGEFKNINAEEDPNQFGEEIQDPTTAQNVPVVVDHSQKEDPVLPLLQTASAQDSGKSFLKWQEDRQTENQRKIKFSKERYFLLGFSCLPAIVDGLGYGVLSFSEGITTLQNFESITFETLTQVNFLLPLTLIASLGMIGTTTVNISENKRNILNKHSILDQKTHRHDQALQRVEEASTSVYLKDHPAACIVIALGGIVEGVIFFSNLGYIINQFGTQFNASPLFYPGMTVAGFITLQFIAINGPLLVNYIRHGYRIYDYTKGLDKCYKKWAAMAFVNIPPLLSTSVIWSLAAVEDYQLAQYAINQFEPEDISDSVAWIPGLVLGSIYTVSHYLLFGMFLKKWLAHVVMRLRFGTLPPDEVYTARTVISYIGLYLMASLLGIASVIIGFGALDEALYTFLFNEAPPDLGSLDPNFINYNTLFPLPNKSALFAVPILALGFEGFVVEGLRFMKLATNKGKPKLNNPDSGDKENQKIRIKGVGEYYRWDKLVSDAVMFVTVGGIKLALDEFFMPDDASATDFAYRQAAISSILFGLSSISMRLFQWFFYSHPSLIRALAFNNLKRSGFFKLSHDEQRAIFGAIEEKKLEIHKFNREINREIRKKNPSNLEKEPLNNEEFEDYNTTPTTERKTKPGELSYTEQIEIAKYATPATRNQLLIAVILQNLLATGVLFGTHFLVVSTLTNIQEGEEDARLASAQTVSTMAAGVATVVTYRVWGWIDEKASHCASSIYTFFSRKDNTISTSKKDIYTEQPQAIKDFGS